MLIAVDIDNTLVDNASSLYGLLNKNHSFLKFKDNLGRKVDMDKDIRPTIFNKIIPIFNPNKFTHYEGAVSNVNKLVRDNEIVLLSSRPYALREIQYLTKKCIEDSGLNVDAVYLNCKHKWEFCQNYHVDMLIDNSLAQCEEVSKKANIKCVCFGEGENDDLNNDIIYLNDWNAINDYITLIKPILDNESRNYIDSSYMQNLRANFRENRQAGVSDRLFDFEQFKTPERYNNFIARYELGR